MSFYVNQVPQSELSVSPITTSNVEEISESCCLICVSMCDMLNRLRKIVTKKSRISGQMTLVPIWPLNK